jgi:peptidoglycan hydrolase CwlO-like protein
MGRLALSHLTFTGTNAAPASVDFSPHVTVIHGPSDTGKSFIVDAIDFVLGAKELKEIPEREGYSRVLLGLELPTGERITLARSVDGGSISLYRSDIRVEPSTPADETLAAKHSAASTKNISRFLLDQVDLDEKQVRKNARNETHMLSFRDLTRLCLIGETEMQAEEAPGLSGNPVNKTKEVSALKLLLTGEDDSALTAVTSPQEQKRLRGARQEVVERMLSQLESQLQDVAEPTELATQLGKLNSTIDEHSTMIGSLTEQRGQLLVAHSKLQSADNAQRSEYSDAAALRQRFTLLQKQYESDLARLEMIAEAGNLLGYFRRGTCVFCGAEPASQHLNLDCEGDTTSFGVSVDSETRKTQGLLDDLRVTIENLDARTEVLRASIRTTRRDALSLQKRIEKLDARINPEKGNLRELLAKRSEIEKHMGLYEQVKTFEDMIRRIAHETEAEVATAVAGLSLTAVREFSAEISKRLAEWDYRPRHPFVTTETNLTSSLATNGARRTVREYARFSTPPLRSPSPNIVLTGKCHTLDSSCSTRPSSPTDHRISPQRRTTSHRRALSGPSTVTSRPTLTVRSSSWRTPTHWTRSETTRATSASRSTSTWEGTVSCLSSMARGLPTP